MAVNSVRGLDFQDRLVDRCSFPLLQDVDETPDDEVANNSAMEAMDGAVYDMYVYRADGRLHVFLPNRGGVDTYLGEEPGYENVKAALLSALANEPYEAPFPPMDENAMNDGDD